MRRAYYHLHLQGDHNNLNCIRAAFRTFSDISTLARSLSSMTPHYQLLNLFACHLYLAILKDLTGQITIAGIPSKIHDNEHHDQKQAV